jgi:exodeoxyribonuclease VII small subunit
VEAWAALELGGGGLARGEAALEESIKLYERGAELKKRCEAKLKEAEEKVEQVTLDANGNAAGTRPSDST